MLRGTQLFLGPFAIFDVGAMPYHLRICSLLVPERHGSNNNHREFPSARRKPWPHPQRSRCDEQLRKGLYRPSKIGQGGCSHASPTDRGETSIRSKRLFYGYNSSVGQRDPHIAGMVSLPRAALLAPAKGLFVLSSSTCDPMVIPTQATHSAVRKSPPTLN